WNRDSTCQVQKFSAGKFHFEPPFTSFDYLVGAAEQRQRHGNAQRLGGLEVQEHLDFRSLLDRQVARLFAFENACGVNAGETVSVAETASIARHAAGCDELAVFEDRGHSMAEGQRGEVFAPSREN